MNGPGLVGGLVFGAILFCGGLLIVAIRPAARRAWTGELALLGASAVAASALRRHEILDGSALTVALIALVGGVVLIVAIVRGGEGGDA